MTNRLFLILIPFTMPAICGWLLYFFPIIHGHEGRLLMIQGIGVMAMTLSPFISLMFFLITIPHKEPKIRVDSANNSSIL